MRYAGLLALLLSLVWVNPVGAHEIGIGDVLFSDLNPIRKIETYDLIITTESLDEKLYGEPYYRVTLQSKETGAEGARDFFENAGRPLNLVALNWGYYCDEGVIFITLRQGWPKLAGILQFRFETHAFHEESLEFLATADGPYEDITPFERGTDFEYPVQMPQRFAVECTPRTEAQGFQFSITDRAGSFP